MHRNNSIDLHSLPETEDFTNDSPIRKAKIKNYYPLIGRLRIAAIVEAIKGDRTSREFARFLNEEILKKAEFAYVVEMLGTKIFNYSNVRRLLLAGEEDETSFEPALLQFIAPLTGYDFGELMCILSNSGNYRMSEVSALMYRGITDQGWSEQDMKTRLASLSAVGFGMSWDSFNQFRQGQGIPSQDELRVIKEVIDPNELVISEADWIQALLSDRGKGNPRFLMENGGGGDTR